MIIAGGGQTSTRMHRQTVPISGSVTTRGRRQGDGGRLGPCTRMDDGATTEGDCERAARHLRATCSAYTLRPPPPYAPDRRGLPPTPCNAPRAPSATLRARERPIPASLRFASRGYSPRALRPSRGGADRGEGDSGRPPLRCGATTRSSEQGAHNSPARTAVALPPIGIYESMCLSASFVVRPRIPALVDGRPSTSQGIRYGATVPGGDRLPRYVLLSYAFSLMPRRARVRSLFPPRYEPSRCASCARIASDCLRVLLALVRVSVPLVDRTAPLRYARLSTSSQTRAHPCAGMARVTLASDSPPLRGMIRGTAARRKGGYAPPAAASALTPRRRPRV